jgi:hypothetical protein
LSRAVVVTALIVLTSACAAPKGTPVAATSPIPSPTPTPTAPLQVTTPPFHAGEVGVDYAAVDLAATGGAQPYTWTTSAGVVPDGLTLSSSGHVSGTPTRGGGFSFTVQVSDAGGSAASLPATIGIAAAPAASLIPACARACSVEVGCVDVCGTFGALTGGTAPFTYAVQPGGFIPVGTHLNGLALAGTFTQRAQYWQFTVVVTDALGQTTSLTPTFYVFPHISLASGSCLGNYVTGCSVKLAYSGGAGTPSAKITNVGPYCSANGCTPASGPPPSGYVLSASGGVVTVSIPKGILSGYRATWTLVITDQSLCASGLTCSSSPATLSINVIAG